MDASKIIWEEPPPKNSIGRPHGGMIDPILAALRMKPNTWGIVLEAGINAISGRMDFAKRLAGDEFEFTTRRIDRQKARLYGRFIGKVLPKFSEEEIVAKLKEYEDSLRSGVRTVDA